MFIVVCSAEDQYNVGHSAIYMYVIIIIIIIIIFILFFLLLLLLLLSPIIMLIIIDIKSPLTMWWSSPPAAADTCFCSHSKTPTRIISKYLQYAYWPWGICLVIFFCVFQFLQQNPRWPPKSYGAR